MNPGEDLDAEAEQALADFEDCKAAHEQLIAHRKKCIIQYRHLRAITIPLLTARTEKLKMIELEDIVAEAEAEKEGAEDALRVSIEAVRLARERYGMVRSKMADRREEMGMVRDGGYRGP